MLKRLFYLPIIALIPSGAIADWQPLEQVPLSLRQQISPSCTGAFIDPFTPLTSEQVAYQGNQSEYNIQTKQYTLLGDAQVQQQGQWIAGDQITFNQASGVAKVSGNYQVREPGFYAQGTDVQRDGTGAYRAIDGRFVLHDSQLNGYAEQYTQLPDGKLKLRNVRFSRCAPQNNTWQVGSHRLTVDRANNRAHALSAWVNVKGVPVLWLPYLSVPLDDSRATGLLTPTIKFGATDSDLLGRLAPQSISLPLYLNLAPNYDSTLTWHWYNGIGSRPQGEIRYLTQSQQGQIDFSRFIAQNSFVAEQADNPDFIADRWFWQAQHQGKIGQHTSLTFKAADASDSAWQQDFNFAEDPVTTYDQYAKISWRKGAFNAGLLFDQTEPAKQPEALTLADRHYRLWPQLTLGYTDAPSSNTKLTLSTALTRFNKPDYDELEEEIAQTPGASMQVERLNASLQLSSGWGTRALPGKANLSVNRIQHWLTDAEEDRETPRGATIPTVDIGQSIVLTNEQSWQDRDWRFSLTPTVKYLYSPLAQAQIFNPVVDTKVESDQYNNPSRFSGGDAIGDFERLQLSLSHAIAVNGQNKFTASVSQGLKLSQERLRISGSTFKVADVDSDWQHQPTGIQLKSSWTPSSDWQFSGLLEFDYQGDDTSKWLDRHSYDIAKRSVSMHYSRDRQFINASWQREGVQDDELENQTFDDEFKVSSQIALSDTFALVGGATWHNEEGEYDGMSPRKVLYGAEWDSCCTHVRVIYQTDLQAREYEAPEPSEQTDEQSSAFASLDDGLFIELRLKGVAAHNDGIDELLRQFKGYAGRLFQFR